MRKIKTKTKQKDFSDDTPDIVGFNKEMLKSEFKDIKSFEVKSKGKQIKVDIEHKKLFLEGSEVELGIDLTNATDVKWINFVRKRIIYHNMKDKEELNYGYGVGFQCKKNGKSIKRYLLVTSRGHSLEVK